MSEQQHECLACCALDRRQMYSKTEESSITTALMGLAAAVQVDLSTELEVFLNAKTVVIVPFFCFLLDPTTFCSAWPRAQKKSPHTRPKSSYNPFQHIHTCSTHPRSSSTPFSDHFLSPAPAPSFLSPCTFLTAACTLGSLGSTPGRPAMAWLASTAGVLLLGGSTTSCCTAARTRGDHRHAHKHVGDVDKELLLACTA